ncbi:MAG: hypothetical protein ACO1SV_10740 [Fimbriimonas sp.]
MPRIPATVAKGFVATGVIGVIAVALVYGSRLRAEHREAQTRSIENFELSYAKPDGWKEVGHGPQALFVYQDPESGVRFRGSVNQVVAEFNPTPTLTSDGLARQMVSNTKENMPGWNGVVLEALETPTVGWRLVRRFGQGKCVVSAFGVRGNTTAMVSMVADGKNVDQIEAKMPHFREFLQTVKFSKADLASRFPE